MENMKHDFKVCIALCFLIISSAWASAQEVGKVYALQGKAERRSAGQAIWTSVDPASKFFSGDTLRTLSGCRLGLVLNDGALIRLNENSQMTFRLEAQTSNLNFQTGQAHYFSRVDAHPKIETPIVSGSIRGTEFALNVSNQKVSFAMLDGVVELANKYGALVVGEGEEANVKSGQAPVKQLLLRPQDAVQWAIYFPAQLFAELGTYHSGRLATIPELLVSGQFERAEGVLGSESLVGAESERSLREALWALLAIAKNQRDLGIDHIQKALHAAPNSEVILLIASYVYQANLNLKKALEWAEQALETYPNSSAAKLRVAELYLSFGDTETGSKLITAVLKGNPENSLALMLKGFVELTTGQATVAKELFLKSIALDPSAGMPHLGLGLSYIKEGDLRAGEAEIEKAIQLEPTTAVYRSYLGKAFFENDDYARAQSELDNAIKFDPNDPTPYLYRSYLKLANFSPIEALWDLEDSIAKNDNRAVYRSSLLLDQDQGIRSAGLSQVFSALGFGEVARVEASRSLQHDYSNYSAHFLKAASHQSNGPVFNQAALTENLTASLLAPVGYNSLLLAAGGQASLNEYNSLFERPTQRLSIAGYGNTFENTIENEIRAVGSTQEYSYFLRYANTYSDGYRTNDHFRQNILRGLAQVQLSPNDIGLLDISLGFLNQGDNGQYPDSSFNDSDLELKLRDLSGRVGYHHTFSQQSHLIAQLVGVRSKLTSRDDQLERDLGVDLVDTEAMTVEQLPVLSLLNEKTKQTSRGYHADIAQIWDSELVSLVAGAGVSRLNSNDEEKSDIIESDLDGLAPFTLTSRADLVERSETGYLYSTWHLRKWLDFNAGLNWRHLQFSQNIVAPFVDDTDGRSRWNPKVGVTLYPSANLSFRLAYFETLGGSGTRDLEQLEPSEVGGFNQVFENFPGDRARNYGLGIDYKIAKSSYFGLEAVRRKLTRDSTAVDPILAIDLYTGETSQSVSAEHAEQYLDEDIISGYWYQILTKRWIASLASDWSRLNDRFYETEMRTFRNRFGVTYFDPSGFFGFSKANFRHQNRDDLERAEEFLIVDLGLGYQLPHRHGSIRLAVENLTDRQFNYLPTSREASLFSGRALTLFYTVNF